MSEPLETPPPPEPVPAPVEPPAPEPPADPDEAAAIDVQGGKHVPLAALKAVREENKVLREKAGRVDQLTQRVAELTPYEQFLKANPQLTQREAPVPAPVNPANDPELVRIAKLQDYYKQDGTLNLDRASEYRETLQGMARNIAQQMVQPIQARSENERATANYRQTLAVKSPDGRSPNKATVDYLYSNLPTNLTSDPGVAQLITAAAFGLDTLGGQMPPAPTPPGRPPVHTEGAGNVPNKPQRAVSELETRIVGDRMKPETYQKLTADFRPGRTNVLED